MAIDEFHSRLHDAEESIRQAGYSLDDAAELAKTRAQAARVRALKRIADGFVDELEKEYRRQYPPQKLTPAAIAAASRKAEAMERKLAKIRDNPHPKKKTTKRKAGTQRLYILQRQEQLEPHRKGWVERHVITNRRLAENMLAKKRGAWRMVVQDNGLVREIVDKPTNKAGNPHPKKTMKKATKKKAKRPGNPHPKKGGKVLMADGYAYELDNPRLNWKTVSDDHWDIEVQEGGEATELGRRRIDDAAVIVMKRGGKVYAQTVQSVRKL